MQEVSVVLPCYDGARWISRAIESVLAQTYERFELVIIDDGSKDNSKEMIAPYLHNGRVRCIYQNNRGFSAAINRGIKESNGNLIGFIGQDDLWMPNKLELQIKYSTKHPDMGLVCSNYYSVDSEERAIRIERAKMPNLSSRPEVVNKLFLCNFIGFETVLVKRECFAEVGLFDERMIGCSDHDIWLRIAGQFNIGYLNMVLVKKRQHKLQLSTIRKEDVLRDEFLMVEKALARYPFLKKVERKKLASLYYLLGMTLLQKGDIAAARKSLLKTIRLQPWNPKGTFAYIAPHLYDFGLSYYQQFAQIHGALSWLEN